MMFKWYSDFASWFILRFFSAERKRGFDKKNHLLNMANISLVYKEYFAISVLTVFLTCFFSFLSLILLSLLQIINILSFVLIVPFVLSFIVWRFHVWYPYFLIHQRGNNIDMYLPYAVNFISTMAVAGVSPLEIFQAFSSVEVYGEIQHESKKIVQEIQVMGVDYITALKHAIERSPSRKFKAFLQGMIGSIQSGSDLHEYLINIVDQYMQEDLIEKKKELESLALIAEVFVSVLIAFPIFFIIIASVMGFIDNDTSSAVDIIFLFAFIILPIAYVFYYLLVRSTSSEYLMRYQKNNFRSIFDYIKTNRPSNGILLISCLLEGILLISSYLLEYVGILEFTSSFVFDFIFLSILIFLGPISFYHHNLVQSKKDMQKRLPDFFIEIENSVSAGLTVFESMKIAAKGNFGRLSSELQKMKAELSWHIPMTRIFSNFSERMKTGIVSRVIVMINMGLGMSNESSKIFRAAAREVSQVNILEEQRRSEMSNYVSVIFVSFFIFLGIIYVLDATFFSSFFDNQQYQIVQTAGIGFGSSLIDAELLENALYSFVFIQGFGAGLIGGFMMDGKLSSAARYSFILCGITILMFKLLI